MGEECHGDESARRTRGRGTTPTPFWIEVKVLEERVQNSKTAGTRSDEGKFKWFLRVTAK